VYPEENRAANMRDFFAALALQALYFGTQAAQHGNAFLRTDAAAKSVLFAGRAVLAYNRILFPCPKQLTATVAAAPEKPEGLLELMAAVLGDGTSEAFLYLFAAVRTFTDWGLAESEVLTRFMVLDEWRWLEAEPELAQR